MRWLLLIPMAIVPVICLPFGIRVLMHDVSSYSFPCIVARVVDVGSDSDNTPHLKMVRGAAYAIYVTDSYTIGPTTYVARRPVSDYCGIDEAKSIFNRYHKGDSVMVYYDPAHPERSSLQRGRDLTSDLVFVFLCMVLPMAWIHFFLRKKPVRQPWIMRDPSPMTHVTAR